MYRIDRETNSVTPLDARRFGELDFRERDHVQIWIEKHPEILGEELLVIQKEFDGWSEASERLDLLALDKSGHIVVIENKLDDSGRDTVWQAMKYAAYCSTLTKKQIVGIYARYLRGESPVETAAANIVEFLEAGSIDEITLNPSNQQRMILTARSFRTEVTATCLWLIGNDINIKCIELRPFQDGEALYLSAGQVIPPPKTEEFMVGVGVKEKAEASQSRQATEWMLERKEFFTKLLSNLSEAAAEMYANRTPGSEYWVGGSSGTSGFHFYFHLLTDRVRVEFACERTREESKYVYDQLENDRNEIDRYLTYPVLWKRLDQGKASKIQLEKIADMTNHENWPGALAWLDTSMNALIAAFQPRIKPITQSPGFIAAGRSEAEIENI
ncbi:DUF4268 domain-containing protein [uncultured Algimonas sp.]|uniref:DUF4268 domain-containing protein n=1 Tax=uncultured Algimonas sp. TaxID=1547920 RepID=UPI00262C5B26|nr:DUF4268 domain-containing protein [uncultured Algimonas sp.]